MTNVYDQICAVTSFADQLRFGSSGEIFVNYHCSVTEKNSRAWSHKNILMYIVEGSFGYASGDSYLESRAHEVLFIRKGGFILHKLFEKPYHTLMFAFDDAFIKALGAEYPYLLKTKSETENDFMQQPVAMELKSSQLIRNIFISSKEYLNHPAAESRISMELKFKELLVNLLREKEANPFHLYFSWLCNEDAVSFIKLMRDNSHFNFTLDELARAAAMSVSTFKRVFNKHFGMPPGKWLHEQRIARAIVLLSNPKNTISDIAFQLGYNDAAAFTKAFRQSTGRTPGNYFKKKVAEPN